MESPCVQICKLIDSVCVGCFRTTEEIGMWSKYTDKERKEVIKKIEIFKEIQSSHCQVLSNN